MLPNVTQSFKLQRPDLERCRAEAMLRLFDAEHCSSAVIPKLGVNYPPGVICDSSECNAEPKPQFCSIL